MTCRIALAVVLSVAGLSPPTIATANGSRGAEQTMEKRKILVHVTHGPEQPTRAALAFLVARTAVDEGHSVTLFLAGDAVQLIRDPVLDSLTGLGTGKLRELYDAIVAKGGRFYLSGMSSNARGVNENDLKGKPAEFAQPVVLLRLSLEHDRMFTY
jgi:predicted peroxiredoxin